MKTDIVEIFKRVIEQYKHGPYGLYVLEEAAEEIHSLYTTEISDVKILIPTIKRDEAVYFCEPYDKVKHGNPLKGKEMLLKLALSKGAKGVSDDDI